MGIKRKIAALFFALLVIFFSATCYSGTCNELEKRGYGDSRGIFFTSLIDQVSNFYLQQKAYTPGYLVWKTEVSYPGFFNPDKYFYDSLVHHVIRKIFVVDPNSYTPCKSVILFPFHEFS